MSRSSISSDHSADHAECRRGLNTTGDVRVAASGFGLADMRHRVELEDLKTDARMHDSALEGKKRALYETHTTLERVVAEGDVLRAADAAKYEGTIETLRIEMRELKRQLAKSEATVHECGKEKSEQQQYYQQQLSELREAYDKAVRNLRLQREDDQTNIAQLTSDVFRLKDELRRSEEVIGQQRDHLDQLREVHEVSRAQQSQRCQTEQHDLRALRELMEDKDKSIMEYQRRVAELNGRVTTLRHQQEQGQIEVSELQRKLYDYEQRDLKAQAKLRSGAYVEIAQYQNLMEKLELVQDKNKLLAANNRRLLRIMSESDALRAYLQFNAIADEFVYVGDAVGVSYDERGHQAPPFTYPSHYHEKHSPREHGLPHKMCSRDDKRHAPPAWVLTDVRLAVDEHMADLRGGGSRFSAELTRFATEVCAAPHANDAPVTRTGEGDYWVPQGAIKVINAWRTRHFPKNPPPPEMFYSLLIDVNRVWRDKMKHSLKTQESRHKTVVKAFKASEQKKEECGRVLTKEQQRIKSIVNGLRPNHPHAQLLHATMTTINTVTERMMAVQNENTQLKDDMHEMLRRRDPAVADMKAHLAAMCENARRVVDDTSATITALCKDCERCLKDAQRSNVALEHVVEMQRDFNRQTLSAASRCNHQVQQAVAQAEEGMRSCDDKLHHHARDEFEF